jgi:predicted aminopeptidase
VVQACHPLKFEPKRWSFPIVGTVPYLGFFDEAAARAYAKQIEEEEHLDVDVRGASAYSTLGWFKDPVLSSMIGDGPDALGWLVNTVLHESVHATLYIPGQSSLNESLASFVADKLVVEWLSAHLGPQSKELKSYTEAAASGAERVARLHRAYEELDAVYRSGASDDEKRARKAELLAALKADLKGRRELNNASLAGFRTYDTGGPAFERLLQRSGGDLVVFLDALKKLDAKSFPEPQMEDFSSVVDAL